MKNRMTKIILKAAAVLSCILTLTSCDILLMALMMGMASEAPTTTNTFAPLPMQAGTISQSSNTSDNKREITKSRQVKVRCTACHGLGSCPHCNAGIATGFGLKHVCGACKGKDKCGVCSGPGYTYRTEYYKENIK